uniref:Wall-associated receptor kinase galacturonan-binding domain-containing protein n=1 Tax=Fagus sylvatica TaxID=28930 RepID=A0A2N9EP05_FAGSY
MFSCGNINNIGFPFWGGIRPDGCGHRGLELNCDKNNVTIIKIRDVTYSVLNVNLNTQMLTITREDYLSGFCSPNFVNTTLDPTLFDFSLGYQNLTLAYGCALSSVALPGQLTCSSSSGLCSGLWAELCILACDTAWAELCALASAIGFSPVRDRLTSGCLSSLWQYIREQDPTLHFYLLKHYSLPPVVSFFTVLTWVSSFQLTCTQSTRKDMPIQKRFVDIRSVLEERAPELPRGPYAPRASGFPEGESVAKKRKKGEEEAEVSEKQQVPINIETTTKPSSKKGKSKDSRTLQKAVGHVSHKRKHQKEQPAPWQCEFYVDGRPVNEDDSVWKSKDVRGGQIADALGSALLLPKDMKNWKGNDSKHMIENLKRDSVVAVQGVFEAGYRLIEAERLLNESLAENDRLREVEKTASARIREAEIDKLKAELAEARQVSSDAEKEAQATYDRGFADAAGSLRFQMRRECNINFLKGWALALEQAAVDDESELYVLGRRYRPYDSGTPENLEETNVEVLGGLEAFDGPTVMENAEVFDHQERAQTEEVQDMEKGVSDKEDNVDVDDQEGSAYDP